jgi:hypothetical protein
MTSMARVVLALCTPGVLGCRTELVTPVTVGRVTVDPVEISISLGDAVQFTAAVFDEYDASLPSVAVAWSSNRPHVVAVESDGSATALRAGSARVSASVDGVSGSSGITVISSTDCSPLGAGGKGKRKDKDKVKDDDDDDDDDDDEEEGDDDSDDDDNDDDDNDGDGPNDDDTDDEVACTSR